MFYFHESGVCYLHSDKDIDKYIGTSSRVAQTLWINFQQGDFDTRLLQQILVDDMRFKISTFFPLLFRTRLGVCHLYEID